MYKHKVPLFWKSSGILITQRIAQHFIIVLRCFSHEMSIFVGH